MVFNYGRIRIGKWLHMEGGKLNVLEVTWMDGGVVVPENGATTNSKRLVKVPVVESVVVRVTTQEVVHQGRKQRETKTLVKKVLANKVLTNMLLAKEVGILGLQEDMVVGLVEDNHKQGMTTTSSSSSNNTTSNIRFNTTTSSS